ncbi:MAG: pyridoxamine 5'-phosphate oxidase family protein [Syntrophobacteraceae bacterium]
MSSKKYMQSREEMETILYEETLGYLGLSMDGMPYVVPMNYGYIDGKILFHCALTGKKLDYLKANPQVCFSVGRQFGEVVRHALGATCHVDYDSVICYGVARIVEDLEERSEVLTNFSRCLQPNAGDIPLEAAAKCCAVEIKVSEMTGRQHRGGEHSFWKHSFEV